MNHFDPIYLWLPAAASCVPPDDSLLSQVTAIRQSAILTPPGLLQSGEFLTLETNHVVRYLYRYLYQGFSTVSRNLSWGHE